ncbi:MAG: endonuclease/exonuclease/phosphatase family protein [Spirochaetaceae bacterium]|nr:endonuclease/exonuclease/phosphatase family protein [Myxococcales bacterium]MCB9722558.1 endonuclease/exonuclease/phosphatase family protein [Spirochaetaceae bacterium]
MAGSVRIFSGNLWYGRADADALVDLIREYEVDVFAAQELGFENAEAISSELPYGRLEPDSAYHGMGIALRRPAKVERIPLHFRDARRAVLDPGDWPGLERTLDLVNVHFQAPHAMRPFPPPLVRWRQVRGLERYFAENPSDTRAIVGDYNATPSWPLYRRMMRRFEDGAVQVARRQGRRVEPTWGPSAESRRLFRIDHALVAGLEVSSFRVLDIPGSDHSGILLDVAPASSR